MIIGLTGTNAAGKGTVVDYLVPKGFGHYSVRSYLTGELQRRGMPVDRENMQDLANKLRAENGHDFIVQEMYRKASQECSNAVIESFRCPGEITSLRRLPSFVLLAIDADQRVRYERAKNRQSATDTDLTFEKFLADEKKEMSNDDPFKQNISKCTELADIFLLNEGLLEDFESKLSKHLNFDSNGYLARRPSWDETFMHEAYTWAARSTCLRRKVGGVVAEPITHAMISQGYNGSPRGTSNCIDLGFCERQKNGVPSGQRLEECRAVHGEPNAVINAGKQGKSVEGGILYTTTFPCQICAGIILNAGIKEIVYDVNYPNPKAKKTFEDAGINTRRFEGVCSDSFNKLFRTK